MNARTSIGMIVLSTAVVLACNDDAAAPADSGPGDVLPGALEVSITVTGPQPDPDGYAVVVSPEEDGAASSRRVKSTSGTARFPYLRPGTHSVALESLAVNCSVLNGNPRSITVRPGEESRISFAISCPAPELAGLYDRESPLSSSTSSSERYLIEESGTFQLQQYDGETGSLDHEWTGKFTVVGTSRVDGKIVFEIEFDFEASSTAGEWRATGTLRGDCLTVEYSPVMLVTGFEPGEFCRAAGAVPGVLEVSFKLVGMNPDPDGYVVVVDLEGPGDPPSRTVDPPVITIRFPGLPLGTHSVRLESLAAECSLAGDHPRPFTILAAETSEITFDIFCPGSGVAGVFERVSPHREGTIDFHGALAERYVIQEDGTFALEFQSANYGFFDYTGTYSGVGTEIVFDFDGWSAAGEWRATGTLRGDCLIVEYNAVMWLSDFEPGEYCRPSET